MYNSFETSSSYNIGIEDWREEELKLITDRYYAAAINLYNGSWWVTGGIKMSGYNPTSLKSTELSYRNSTTGRVEFTLGPDLSRGMNGHCITRVNESHIFLGGW